MLRTLDTEDDDRQEQERRAADEAATAQKIAAGGSIVALPPAEVELKAAIEEQRLLLAPIMRANQELEEIKGRLLEEELTRDGDRRLRDPQRRAAAAKCAQEQARSEAIAYLDQLHAAGHSFFNGDLLRRFAP